MSLLKFLKNICFVSIIKAYPSINNQFLSKITSVAKSSQNSESQYQCNTALKLEKILNIQSIIIANNIKAKIYIICNNIKFTFQEIYITKTGFINFIFTKEYLAKLMINQLSDHKKGIRLISQHKKTIIDFSSPNIAKEMHVGHLRSTIIGNTLSNMIKSTGYEILKLNHIGDWGVQFGMLIYYLKNLKKILSIHYTKIHQLNITLKSLSKYYRECKKHFDSNNTFQELSKIAFDQLRNYEFLSIIYWRKICKISNKENQNIYKLLNISILNRGESFYDYMLKNVIKLLVKKQKMPKGIKYIHNKKLFVGENSKIPLMIEKINGINNYATIDLAALKHRIVDENASWIIYVTDTGQMMHFNIIITAARLANFFNIKKKKINHVMFGLVLRSDGKKYKTRSGEIKQLLLFLKQAIKKVTNIIKNRDNMRNKKSAHVLCINAIIYSSLSYNRIQNYIFNYEKMLKFTGNTGAFLLYSYVRSISIQNKSKIHIPDLIRIKNIKITESAEVDLILHLCHFVDTLYLAIKNLSPNIIASYLFILSNKLNFFIHKHKILKSKYKNSRLLICKAASRTLKFGCCLLGLNILKTM